MISIKFSVGYENQVAVIEHPVRTAANNDDIDALYKEIEAGCPSIRNYNLHEGLFQAEFSKKSDNLKNLVRLTFNWRSVA